MIHLLPMGHDAATLDQYVALFAQVFPKSANFSSAYLTWLYQANPDGLAIGFDAWAGGTLVAHYACIPCWVDLEGVPVLLMLSLNTATHPDHQGKGLFTQLAQLTYESAAARGVQAVFGVANANSTPGFVKKLGFELVRPLEAKLGWSDLGIDWNRHRLASRFQRRWSAASLAWRMANPKNVVRRIDANGRAQFFARAKGRWLWAYAELGCLTSGLNEANTMAFRVTPRLYLGLVPDGVAQFAGFADVPERLRPSPLNFIYRSLADAPKRVDPQSLSVSFLDFDAY
jgi:GNAT superfamily N-acetyltransferase